MFFTLRNTERNRRKSMRVKPIMLFAQAKLNSVEKGHTGKCWYENRVIVHICRITLLSCPLFSPVSGCDARQAWNLKCCSVTKPEKAGKQYRIQIIFKDSAAYQYQSFDW